MGASVAAAEGTRTRRGVLNQSGPHGCWEQESCKHGIWQAWSNKRELGRPQSLAAQATHASAEAPSSSRAGEVAGLTRTR